jgi:hypothetical protein
VHIRDPSLPVAAILASTFAMAGGYHSSTVAFTSTPAVNGGVTYRPDSITSGEMVLGDVGRHTGNLDPRPGGLISAARCGGPLTAFTTPIDNRRHKRARRVMLSLSYYSKS